MKRTTRTINYLLWVFGWNFFRDSVFVFKTKATQKVTIKKVLIFNSFCDIFCSYESSSSTYQKVGKWNYFCFNWIIEKRFWDVAEWKWFFAKKNNWFFVLILHTRMFVSFKARVIKNAEVTWQPKDILRFALGFCCLFFSIRVYVTKLIEAQNISILLII